MNTISMPSGTYTLLSLMRKTNSKMLYIARCEDTGKQVVLCKLLDHKDVYSLLQLISHKNLVRILDIATQSSEIAYVILEYIDAPLLSEAMAQRKLTQREVIRIGIQLCDALHALHSIGLVHRDVKPENIFLLPDGTVKLFDYDTSRIFKAATASDTTPMGTFGYAAPEQFGLKQSDARSDIYALGILLNTLAAGAHPSVQLCRGFLRHIVLRCTAVSPDRRYRNAAQVQRALRSCLLMKAWSAAAAAVPLLLVLLIMLLPKPSPSAAFLSQSPAPSPSVPSVSAAPTLSPAPSAEPASAPQPTPAPEIKDLPTAFKPNMSSVQKITLDGNTYHLFLGTDNTEQSAPRLQDTQRRVYLSEDDRLTMYLYIWPEDGDLNKIEAFRKKVQSVSYSLETQNDAFEPCIMMDGFGLYPYEPTNLLVRGYFIGTPLPAQANNRPIHHLVSVNVNLTDNRRVTLYLSATLCQNKVTLSSNSLCPMDTTDTLNRLLDSLDELFGPDTSITLELPVQTYTEPVIIPNRSVTLVGAAEGTVFQGGLRIDKSSDGGMICLNNIVFQGSGSGTAIVSERSMSLNACTFNDYDACYAVSESATVTGSSIMGNVPFTELRQPGVPDLTTAAGLNAYLAYPPDALADLPSFTVQLPAVTYKEEIVINRAVSLKGAPMRKTVFLGGLRYEGQGDKASVHNCTFISDDLDIAVSSTRDLQITDCSFDGFVYAAMPAGSAEITFRDCNFNNTEYLLPDWPSSGRD